MNILKVKCNASGSDLQVDTSNYPGDLPSDYGYKNDSKNVSWVNWDYAQQDSMYQDDTCEPLPEGTPYWVAS